MLRERWSQLLDRRREYLNAQIQRYINKLDKTELECEREVSGGHGHVILRLTAARLSSGSLADFLARKDLADFLLYSFDGFSRRRFCVFCEEHFYRVLKVDGNEK